MLSTVLGKEKDSTEVGKVIERENKEKKQAFLNKACQVLSQTWDNLSNT